jgi:signal transduction histidine kinase
LQHHLDVIVAQERMAALGRMAASLAHQVNNPLQVIVGSLEAYGGYGRPGLEHPLLRQAMEKTLYLGEIVKSITMFVRPGSGPESIIDVNDTVHKSLMLASERIKEQGIEVALQFGPNVQGRMASPSDLIQVMANLIDNACDAMGPNGRLCVETATNGTYSIIKVRDSGVGMDEHQKKHIFEPFFTTKENGSGFGLAVVYSIIERAHGKITVTSEVGEGTLFEICVPK